MKYKIAVCDDQKIYRDMLQDIINEFFKSREEEVEIIQYTSGEELLESFNKEPNYYDIIFLDVIMGELSGIKTAEQIRLLNQEVQIIFLTISTEYILNGYDVGALHYLIKPPSNEKIEELLDKCIGSINRKEVLYYTIKTKQGIEKILLDDIEYFEIVNRVIIVSLTNGDTRKFYNKMDVVEKQLSESSFIRVHRGYLVNLKYVEKIELKDIIFSSGANIPISRRYLKYVKDKWMDYIMKE